jgi:transcriptional regulator with XRE-family HTH domain
MLIKYYHYVNLCDILMKKDEGGFFMRAIFDKEVLGKRITETRKNRQLNQAELALQAGVTPAAISQIEKGLRVPTTPVIHSIARVLGVSIDYLTGKTDKTELQDLLQDDQVKAFFRGFESLKDADKELIRKQIEFLKSSYRDKKQK